jgi:hypothetical protein
MREGGRDGRGEWGGGGRAVIQGEAGEGEGWPQHRS